MQQFQLVFPNSLHEFKLNVGNGLVIIYQLDFYERWIVHIRLALGENKFHDLFSVRVGTAENFWIGNHFGDDDSDDF